MLFFIAELLYHILLHMMAGGDTEWVAYNKIIRAELYCMRSNQASIM